MNTFERDELLIEMEQDLKFLRRDFENHLAHHAKYTYLAFSTLIGMVITLIILIIKMI